VLIGLGQSG
jgi:hypothetical protein